MPRLLASLALLALSSGCIVPGDASPAVDLDLALVSQHMHRGMVQVETGGAQAGVNVGLPAEPVPGLEAGRFDVRAWGNMDLNDDTGDSWFPDGHAGKFTEIHAVVAHTQPLGPVAVQTGVFSYILPNGLEFPFGERGQTSEFFVTVSGDLLGAVPALSVRYDFDEADSIYLLGSLSEEFPINDEFSVRATGTIGFSGAGMSSWNYGIHSSGLSDLGGELALDYFFDDRTTFEIKVAGSTILDGAIDDWFDVIGIESDNVWFGGAVRFSF